MRIPILTAVAAIILGLTVAGSSLAAAQSQETTHTTKKTFGYMDSRGVFHSIPRAVPASEDITRTYTGTLEVDVTVTLKTKISTSEKVLCEGDFTASSIENSTQSVIDYEETAVVYASSAVKTPTNPTSTPLPEVAPSTETCKILIPYSWSLPPAGPEYTNSLEGDLSLAIVTTSTTSGAQTVWRSNQQAIPVASFPDETSGDHVTKFTVNATL